MCHLFCFGLRLLGNMAQWFVAGNCVHKSHLTFLRKKNWAAKATKVQGLQLHYFTL